MSGEVNQPVVLLSDETRAALKVWLEVSAEGFEQLKALWRLPDAWTFSIVTPDVATDESGVNELEDPAGAVAFTLRRIQALRFVLISEQSSTLSLVSADQALGMASEIMQHLDDMRNRPGIPGKLGLTRLRVASGDLVVGLIRDRVAAGDSSR